MLWLHELCDHEVKRPSSMMEVKALDGSESGL